MRAIKPLFLYIVLLFVASCSEKFDFNLPPQAPKIIIDALITDGQPPYFVRLTLSNNANDKGTQYYDSARYYGENLFTPVLDAQIIISDNKGNMDTLIKDYTEGYYRTTSIQGKAGNTYNLLVKWQGEEYISTCTMPICPKIDSVTYKFTLGEIGKYDYYVPHIWFKDNPDTKNYYLFKTYGGHYVWSRSILSDEFIADYVSGLNVFKGESREWWQSGYPMERSPFKIEMYAITKEVYEYYKGLISQFRSDGGAYTPTPASPASNISGNSQGCFNASALQIVEDDMP